MSLKMAVGYVVLLSSLLVIAFCSSAECQSVILREKPNAVEKQSLFEPVSATSADGLESIRAKGAYAWNMTPLIIKKWTGEKALVLAVEVVGSNLTPSTSVLVIDGKTFVAQSATWQVDSRGNLAAILEKEGLVRNLATAAEASITVFAPSPVTATFHSIDLAVFRSLVKSFDRDAVELAAGEAIKTTFAAANINTVAPGHTKVTVVANAPSTTAYDWQMNGRVSVRCYWNTCDGYYTAPQAGTQQVQGAVIRLLRDDGSIVIAECVSKTDFTNTLRLALDSANSNGGPTPTVYRDCRVPAQDTAADADFRKENVKLTWHPDGSKAKQSETYFVLGVLRPVSSH